MSNENGKKHVVISGCSSGGKSTMLNALSRRGFETVEEPGRRIVLEELAANGNALPWVNLEAFAKRALQKATTDRNRHAKPEGWVFFDRGLVDAAVALNHANGTALSHTLHHTARYHRQVFITPPWPEIFIQDRERQHGLDEATEEYDRLLIAYQSLGYETILLPKMSVNERVEFLLNTLAKG